MKRMGTATSRKSRQFGTKTPQTPEAMEKSNPAAGWMVRWTSFFAGVARSLLPGGKSEARRSRREEKRRRKELVRQAKATKRLRKAA